MANPYEDLPADRFWSRSVTNRPLHEITPIAAKRFDIENGAQVATAGSCFAQEVGRRLAKLSNVRLLLTENPEDESQPLFSARYGNIYTVGQLVQLFDRAHGSFSPVDVAWRRADGRYVDPFRPYVVRDGFATADDVVHERERHLAAVRRLFAECSLFVFTLGLTEGWRSVQDHAVFPVAPGVVTDYIEPDAYEFHNATYPEVTDGLRDFADRLATVNASARILLTVSPVPLIATYTQEHVLVATTHSKAILRAACSELEAAYQSVYYFPSYEIVSSVYTRGAYYNTNMRTVTQEGIDHVMSVFQHTYFPAPDMTGARAPTGSESSTSSTSLTDEPDLDMPVCDEEEIVRSIGFS